jgi:phosphoribosylformimino-5-aminoimidazole carboxamide ribotide isomerase
MCIETEVELVELLAKWSPIPMTYAGGISSMEDIEVLEKAGQGKLDFTVGSALDIFGGTGLAYQNVVDLCNQ